MDDKKKSIPEETKAISSDVEEVVEFDDIRNALDKLEAKKASLKQVTGVVEVTEDNSDKKVTEEKVSENNIGTKKEVESDNKETTEKTASEEKKETTEKSSGEEKTVKDSDSDNKEIGEKASEDKKKEATEKTSDTEGKAITQSKRLADAKAAKELAGASEGAKKVKKSSKDKKGKNGIAIFFATLVSLLVIVYVAGFVYFSNYFYPDVAINGTNVSNMNKETAKQTLDAFYKDYVLTLETIDAKKVTIAGSDILMNIKLHDDFNKCLKEQQAYMWFLNMMEHHDYTIAADVTWDADLLEKTFSDMKMLDKKLMTAPKDAYIGIQDGEFAIIPEEMGTTLIVDKFKTTVTDNLTNVIAYVNLKEAGCYELPKVYDTDEALAKEFNAKSEFIGGVITLQLDDLTLEPGMDLYDAVLQKNGDSYSISKTKVQQYVKELAGQYDTMGKERTFTTSFDDKQIKIAGTAFGYEMDQEATANALYTALQAKKTTTVEVIFKTKGHSLQGENDIGDTYIEVNLSEQKVIAYKGGRKIVEGDCVSGCEANGNGTCLGLYEVQDKLSPTVLRGEKKPVTKTVTKKNKKGKKVKVEKTTMEYEYESPVTYWLQFNGGYGLHDAAGWRSSYGGSIYLYNGSHGCVNLPLSVAKTLYENFQLGDPVIVYFWDNENRK